tara:strand:+ start:9437 stop:11965 length:2529 start_codon:yes stop_codon:yes gene_type:complete
MKTCLLCIVLSCASIATADESLTASGLSLEFIMQDPDWIGNTANNAYFGYDSGKVYFEQKRSGELFSDHFEVDIQSNIQNKIPAPLDSAQRHYNPTRSAFAFTREGDIFYRDTVNDKIVQVTQTLAKETSPQFTPDGSAIVFQQAQKVFLYHLPTHQTRQLAEFITESDPLEDNTQYSFLTQQESLFADLSEDNRRTIARKKTNHERQTLDTSQAPPATYLGEDYKLVRIYPSPDGNQSVIITTRVKDKSGDKAQMPNYVTNNGYVQSRDVRTKVGEAEPSHQEAWLVNHNTAKINQITFESLPGIKDDPLKNLRKSAMAWHLARGGKKESLAKLIDAPDNRPLRIQQVRWNAVGTHAALMIFSIDNKDRWLATIKSSESGTAKSGTAKSGIEGNGIEENGIEENGTEKKVPVKNQHQLSAPDSWVGYSHNNFGWTPDGNALWFLSEQDGYSHIYSKPLQSSRAKQLTKGAFVVESPILSRDGSQFYFVANKENSGRYHLYGLSAAGGDLIQLSDRIVNTSPLGPSGSPPFALSADETQLLFKHGSSNRPPELFLIENHALNSKRGKSARQLSNTTSKAFLARDWRQPQFVSVPSSQFKGSISARLYQPSTDNSEPGAAVIFVHGAGYLQNAHEGWSAYFREYMFHQLLNEHGITVLDIDYRGSRGYGAKWRTSIYRQMGYPEIEDISDSVDWLVKNKSIDPSRIGIYGGSYGGFLTLMAMFRTPETFAVGAALRPVTDWAHYNHGYTSNILNTPMIDPQAYEKSSPLYYAEQYQNRPLLIAHGMQDDNVHVQDSVRLAQRLIELKKENFETAYYPLDPHGFKHASSWLDEYRRIFKLFKTL